MKTVDRFIQACLSAGVDGDATVSIMTFGEEGDVTIRVPFWKLIREEKDQNNV